MASDFIFDDPLGLDEHYNEEEKLIDKISKDFAKKELEPKINDDYLNNGFAKELLKQMGDVGLLGIMSAEEYGGSAANHVSYGLACKNIEAIDSAYRSAMSVQSSLVIYPIEKFGTKEQKEKYLPGLIAGDIVGCFGLTEPDGGSDPANLRAKAVYKNGKFILNGEKMWITNSPFADLAVVWARLDGEIKGFIVERGNKGFSTPKLEGKLSLCASSTGQIVLQDCEVSEDAMLDVSGLKGPFSCLNKARFGISWGVMGAATYCWLKALDYVKDRKLFKKSLASNQLIQFKLANMQTEISLGLCASFMLAKMLDNGKFVPEAISLAKRNNCLKALEITRNCRDMLGGNGIMLEYAVIRHMINLETVNTYEGTADIHALILGRSQTNINSF